MAYASLKEIQNASVEMLLDFHDFCVKNDICYFLTKGSVLGAVRHKGFIPWDDDVDVDMHVDDIEKLISMWELHGDKTKYFLQTKQTDKNLPGAFIRIRKNHTTALDEKYKKISIHWGLPIDIFPVYNYPRSKIMGKVMEALNVISRRTSTIPFYHNTLPAWILQLTTKVCISSLRQMKYISDKSKGSPILYYPIHPQVEGAAKYIAREVYYPAKLIQFETIQLYTMNQPEKYLELEFGDYMTLPPPEKRKIHGSLVDLDADYSQYTK